MSEPKKKPAQRFTALEVREVSLVDEAANEEDFLVIKSKSPPPENKEHEPMATAATQQGSTTEDTEKGKKPPVPPPAKGKEDEMSEEDKKKAEAAKEKAEKVAKLKEEREKVEKQLKELESEGTQDTQKSAGHDTQMMMARMLLDKCHTALYNISGVLNIDLDDEVKKTVEKAKDKAATADDLKAGIEALTANIEKAGKKQLSSERTAKLTEAIKGLMELGAEVSPEVKKALEALQSTLGTDGAKPLAPKTIKGGGTAPEGTSPSSTTLTNKSADDVAETLKSLLNEALKPVLETVKGVSERVESIEKARGGSKTLPEGGTGTDTPVQKGKSFWSGVV